MTLVLGDGQSATRASWARRITARLIDMFLQALALFVALLFHFFSVPEPLLAGFLGTDDGPFTRAPHHWVLLAVALVIYLAVVLYEPVMIKRGSQTIGKVCTEIKLVSHVDSLKPLLGQAFVRWFVPFAAGAIGAAGSIVIFDAAEVLTDFDHADLRSVNVVLLGALVSWTVTHMSSLWSQDGRGWPDRAAGTVVVRA